MSVGCVRSAAGLKTFRTRSRSQALPVVVSAAPAGLAPLKQFCSGNRMSSAQQAQELQTRNGVKVSGSRDDIRIAAPNVDLGSLPEYLKKDCLLFYHPEQAALARKIAQVSDSIELSEIKWA